MLSTASDRLLDNPMREYSHYLTFIGRKLRLSGAMRTMKFKIPSVHLFATFKTQVLVFLFCFVSSIVSGDSIPCSSLSPNPMMLIFIILLMCFLVFKNSVSLRSFYFNLFESRDAHMPVNILIAAQLSSHALPHDSGFF